MSTATVGSVKMGSNFLAKIKQFFKYIVSKFFSNGRGDGNNGKNNQPPRDNEEVPERVITVPDEANVILVQEVDPNEETAIADIVEQNQAIPVPDYVFTAANICITEPEIVERKQPLLSEEKWIKHYRNSHKILLIGEGNFSFSACLAKAFDSAVNIRPWFFPNGRDNKGGTNTQASYGVTTLPDNAHVISVQDNKEPSTDDIVEQQEVSDAHLVNIPDDLFTTNSSKAKPEIHKDQPKEIEAPKWADIKIQRPISQRKETWIKHYSNYHKILLVGEGDFSFSACLAKAFGSANNMTATSLDSEKFLAKNYKRSMSNIKDLKDRGCTVIHNLDATKMASDPQLNGRRFDSIVYNFPLAGFFKSYSRKDQLNFNRNLIRLFMKNAKEMIAEDGQIHITHKTYGFYLEWNLVKLANKNGLRLVEDVQFLLSDYPDYNTKYGFGGDDNFDCYGSRTYKFGI